MYSPNSGDDEANSAVQDSLNMRLPDILIYKDLEGFEVAENGAALGNCKVQASRYFEVNFESTGEVCVQRGGCTAYRYKLELRRRMQHRA